MLLLVAFKVTKTMAFIVSNNRNNPTVSTGKKSYFELPNNYIKYENK
jgi:hypothetical protein